MLFQLSSAFPVPNTVDQDFDLSNGFDFASLPDFDFDHESFRLPDDVQSAFTDLENQLNDKGNNYVEVEHFPGLAEELEKTGWGKTPSSLESIAIRIEKDRGKATELGHNTAQVLG
ncbi:60S ribosomal L24 [Gossypium australe]|uniref:60S ribosomal L24 n=1 Tax=Gossypium australe TaxID=47621 RepID=A0A5B6VS44_9ROSI|nr:60S ribosomal L24 [Gossypium australe]